MSAADDAVLDNAERRWHRLVTSRPDLAAAVELQRVLVTRGLEIGADPAVVAPHATAIPTDLHARFARGDAPVLNLGVELALDRILPHLLGFCDDFAAGGAGEPARNVRRVIEQGEIEPGSLLRASLMRQQNPIRQRATHLGVSPDLVWLVAELSVGPVAHRLQHAALMSVETADPGARTALATWTRGHCAACGSWPAFAEWWAGARHLRCSFCGADWTPPEPACVYCNQRGEAFLVAADKGRPERRLEFCRACGGYLKQVDVETPTAFTLLPLIDLETSDLDAGAVGRGYGRPPMRDRPGANVPGPPDGMP